MKPLNQAERRKAFFNFLIFFLITTGIILVTAYYSIQVPFKDNQRLRNEKEVIDYENAFGDKFQKKLSSVVLMLDNVNKEEFKDQVQFNDGNIGDAISDMSKMIETDTISNKAFYRSILAGLSSSRLAKKELRELKSRTADASEWKDKYDRLYIECQQYRDFYSKYINAPHN